MTTAKNFVKFNCRFTRCALSSFKLSLWCGLAMLFGTVVYWMSDARHLPSTFASGATGTTTFPSLQSGAAITYLKEQGLYASLAEAMVAERAGHSVSGRVGNDSNSETQDQSSPNLFTICNNLVERQKIIATDGQSLDLFGDSVALSGDTAVIGAPDDGGSVFQYVGSAYVFVRSGTGWALQSKLTASDVPETPSSHFGRSVAISGDTVVIGAPGANSGRGAAYVFVRSGTSWSQQQRLIASNGAGFDSFGISVALSGDTVVVGASGRAMNRGSAYVFVRSGTSWSLQEELIANDGATDDNFGGSVALIGDTVVVGAYQDDFSVFSNIGSAYVFVRTGTSWSQQQKLIPTGGQSGDYFGAKVALSGETVVIGAPNDAIGMNTQQGSVYVFVRNGSTWSQQQNLTANDGGAHHDFGSSVAISGDTIVVGAIQVGINRSGSAYVFVRNGTAWSQQQKLTPSDGDVVDEFGASVALSGDTVMVGSVYGDGVSDGTGAVYVFECGGLQFYPLAAPVRLLDTRTGAMACTAPGTPIAGGTSLLQTATGTCFIPATAKAVTGNVTVVLPGANGFLTIYPNGAAQPGVANTNFIAGDVLNNVFTVGLGAADGSFRIFASSTAEVVVDITGYYAPPAAGGLYFHPLPKPIRLLETRLGQPGCFTPGMPMPGNTDTIQQGTTTCDGVTIPATAKALVGNATTVLPSANGFITLYPADAPSRPLAASGNYRAGINLNSPFTVGLSPSGQFKIYTVATTDLVIDVLGYFSADAVDGNGTGLLFNPITPARLLDTRPGAMGACFLPNAALTGGVEYLQAARGVCTIASTAQAIVGNATTVMPAANGFLTFWPSDAPVRPLAATSNFQSGRNFNRYFTVGLGADGVFKMYASQTTNLVVDVSGYFAP